MPRIELGQIQQVLIDQVNIKNVYLTIAVYVTEKLFKLGDDLLRDQNSAADGTVCAFGETGFGVSGRYGCVNNYGVGHGLIGCGTGF